MPKYVFHVVEVYLCKDVEFINLWAYMNAF
jgi:hypothetical protein